MTWSERHLWHRVTIEGNVVQTSGEVRISESVDQLSRVAEFSLAEQPTTEPEEGDSVLIETFDFTAGLVYTVFGGTVNALTIESQPWSMVLLANDQLRLLDRIREGADFTLTGMTPKEALMEVLDRVGCTYDPDDLADPDYVLGEREALQWMTDTPGSQITNELSSVFGCVLMTVGNDRILWLSHDATPANGTGSYATYTRGTSEGFVGHGRSKGDRARIQNNWIVRGVTAEINENCTATPFAKAVGTNPQLGRRRRTSEQVFSSDLIQSEDLAEAIVRRLMRETNRLPDERTTPMVNDPNVHPCTKVTIVDPTYGMGATTYATVLSVDRQGNQMTLRLAAGPGGSEGTVTTGVDKVCNDSHGDLDWPGDGFDFPDFDFPPIDIGEVIIEDPPDEPPWVVRGLLNVVAVPPGGTFADEVVVRLIPTYTCIIYYTDDGSTPTTSSTMYTGELTLTETTTLKFFGRTDATHISPVRTEVYTIGEGGGCSLTIETGDWTDNGLNGGVGPIVTDEIEIKDPEYPYAWDQSFVVPVDQDWVLTMDVDPIGGIFDADTVEWQIGVGNSSAFHNFAVYTDAEFIYARNHGNEDDGEILNAGFIFGNAFSVSLAYFALSGDLIVSIEQDGDVVSSIVGDGGSFHASDYNVQLLTTHGIVHISNLCLALLDADVPFVPGDWEIEYGTAFNAGPGEFEFLDEDDALGKLVETGVFPTDTPTRVQWTGSITVGTTEGVFLNLGLSDRVSFSATTYIQILLDATGGDIVYAYGFGSGYDESPPGDLGGTIAFSLHFDPDANLLTGIVGGVTVSCALDWDTENDIQPTIDHGSAVTLDSLVITSQSFTVGG